MSAVAEYADALTAEDAPADDAAAFFRDHFIIVHVTRTEN